MNNTTDNITICKLHNTFHDLEHELGVAVYYMMTPIYFLIGITTRAICLIAFYRQYKKEKEYAYQIVISFTDMLEIFATTMCFAVSNVCGYRVPGTEAYRRNYPLMWYSAHLSFQFQQAFITASLLIALNMAADRFLSMARPFLYKRINRSRRLFIITIVVCVMTGFLTSAFDSWRYGVRRSGDVYEIYVDTDYIKSWTAFALAWVNINVRVITNLALIFFNIGAVIYFRRHVKETKILIQSCQVARRQKETQKTLILLTISQSIFTTIDITMCNVYFGLMYIDPDFTGCLGKLMAPFVDMTVLLAGILEFFAVFTISKQFRNTLLNFLCCKKIGKAIRSSIKRRKLTCQESVP